MILINKIETPLADVGKRLGITLPLEKILKKPLYEINKALIHADPANGAGATKNRNAMEFPAVFRTQLPGGENVEIRYCTNRTPDVKFMGQTEKYSPRVVEFDGKAEFIADDNDKAVYFYLHFYNKQSPFTMPNVPYDYELVDDEARANVLIEGITLRNKATTHAALLTGNQMVITAKGMRIAGASTMDPMMLKAQLMQFANDKPAEYLNKAESQVNHIEGLIIDSIDKGIFVMENVFNAKRWKWAMGVKAGELIVEMSSSVSNETQALVTHISQHIQDFLSVLIDTSKTVNAESNLKAAVQDIDVFSMLNDGAASTPTPAGNLLPDDDFDDDFDDDSIYSPLPTSYAEAQDYLNKHIGKKTPALASKLDKAIKDGSVTLDNIVMMLEELKA